MESAQIISLILTFSQPYTHLNTNLMGQQAALQLATTPSAYISPMAGLPAGHLQANPALNGLTSAIVTPTTGEHENFATDPVTRDIMWENKTIYRIVGVRPRLPFA